MRRLSCVGAYLLVLLGSVLMAGAGLAQENVRWSYGSEQGPENWADLSDAFAACANGRRQSPIDITGTVSGGGGAAAFDYGDMALDIVNKGHTVQVNAEPGHTAILAGGPYRLLQFHFHSPSEHKVDGRSAAMEAHFVHRNDDGGLAVVGVLIEAGAQNEALGMIKRHMPAGTGAVKVAGATINGADLLPASSAFTTYSGSLTTPPCSEGVRWFVMKEPVTASPEQIAAMQAVMPVNARPVQALNGRLTLNSD